MYLPRAASVRVIVTLKVALPPGRTVILSGTTFTVVPLGASTFARYCMADLFTFLTVRVIVWVPVSSPMLMLG